MKNEPVYLTDQNHNIIIEAILGVPNAAIPDSLRPFDILEPNTSDGAEEKHAPVIETDGNHVTVKVGSIFHPMSEEHSIAWVSLFTTAGCQMRVNLDKNCDPVAHFTLEEGDSPKAAYAYCNLHGFWKTEA